MKKLKTLLLALPLVTGVAFGSITKAGPWDSCNVESRWELDALCPPASVVCCRFFSDTFLYDSNEYFYAGTLYFGTYSPWY